MVVNNQKRGRGRPRKFDPLVALDTAMGVFWELGFEAADTETLSAKMGMTKPSIYNAFGSKEELFLKSLKRYGETFSTAPSIALLASKTPSDGLRAFFVTIVKNVSGCKHPSGCLFACVGMPAAERMPNVAAVLKNTADSNQERIQQLFASEIAKSNLGPDFNVSAAMALMRDLMLSMGVRGRTGATTAELEDMAQRNAELVLVVGQPGFGPVH